MSSVSTERPSNCVRRTLADGATISELAASYDMSFAAVQKHVAVLEEAGLVMKHPSGRERIVRGNPETIRCAQALLDSYEQIWRARIDRLDALLAEDT
ncbi:MAG: putative ArsR-family transcriptional regulator [Pseudonocardiales bacterium]|nr:putative ArsR-family transcriptional regulator [Pseudonocardiales bacterium]